MECILSGFIGFAHLVGLLDRSHIRICGSVSDPIYK